MTAVMIQGCTSWAGKSLLTTALCRWYARQGLSVAPFKAQNMANNARVVPRGMAVGDGHPGWGEIGVAQWLQALAAGVRPDTRMNPVLVKPEGLTTSQVVVDGVVDDVLTALPWTDRAPRLRSVMHAALDSLLAEHDLVVIEGAGSPAEINLDDQVNMPIAHHADAPVLLVADIDRGGAFAHLAGTWAMVGTAERERFAGYVLNRFRGDPGLLAPGPRLLEERTGVPTIGVLPMIDHHLPDEDGAITQRASAPGRPVVAIVRYPTASNLDEFARLQQVATVRWATSPGAVAGADLVILPGSKHVFGDAAWLRETGMAEAIEREADSGTRVLGICGGLQLLGRRIEDPAGVDGGGPDGGGIEGLGLLDVTTTMRAAKVVEPATAAMSWNLGAAWSPLSGLKLDGHHIHHGRVDGGPSSTPAATGTTAFVRGSVLGLLAHGILEHDQALLRLFGQAPDTTLDDEFDRLADLVDEHLDTSLLASLAGDAGASELATVTTLRTTA